MLGIAAAIHLLPGVGVLGRSVLTRAYGIEIVDPNLELLLTHRAVLFAVLGVGFLVAAFRRAWQIPALVAALTCTLTFVVFAWMTTSRTPQIDRVALVDLVVGMLLAVALFARRTQSPER